MLPFEKISTAVASLLEQTPNPSDKEIRALALDLAISEYEAAIRSRLASRDRKLVEERLFGEYAYFVFVEPEKAPVTISEGKAEVVMEKPPRQSYKVKNKDLSAFCKQFGLDVKAMHAVGMGERRDYKGWTRGTGMGGQYELGQPFRQPQPVVPPLTKEQKAVRLIRPWSLPAQDWTPEN